MKLTSTDACYKVRAIRSAVNLFCIFPAITCPSNLFTPANGNYPDCDNENNYGSTCMFSCKEGFGLFNTATMTCDGDGNSPLGQWSSEEPICLGKCDFGILACCNNNVH